MLRSHKICPSLRLQLCDARAPNHGRSRTYPASPVDVGRVGRAELEPGIHRLVDVCVWMLEWHIPIRLFPTLCLTLRSTGRRSYQRLSVRADLRHVPIGELGTPSFPRRSTNGAHHVTAIGIRYRRDRIQCRIHVHFFFRAQQAIAGREKWPRAGGGVNPTHGGTRRSGSAVCVFHDE